MHDRININGISLLTENDYEARGSTALLDAIGFTIQKIVNVQKRTSEDQRAEKVLFVITTDGMENASREFTADKIKKMVQHQKEKYGWEFLFFGANIDAIIQLQDWASRRLAVDYHSDAAGTQVNYEAVCEAVISLRNSKKIDRSWKKGIEEDYNRRLRNER